MYLYTPTGFEIIISKRGRGREIYRLPPALRQTKTLNFSYFFDHCYPVGVVALSDTSAWQIV